MNIPSSHFILSRRAKVSLKKGYKLTMEIEFEVEEEPEIFVVVEQMPEIIGGNAKIYENLVYPVIARQAGVEGLSVIQVVVEPDGTPSDITVARSASEMLDQAAITAVSQLRFIPGKQRGVPVRVRMAIPIRFRLKRATC